MSAILACSARRLALATACETAGLADHASTLRSTLCDRSESLLAEATLVRKIATGIHAAAAHAGAPVLADTAVALEQAAASAIVAVDRVIAEKFEADEAAKTRSERPVFSTGRHMNLHRGDDR